MKRATLVAMTAASLLCMVVWSTGVYAQVSINIEIGVPPPAPLYEVVPAPRPGYVWVPGYWGWDAPGHKHRWKKGRWEHARPDFDYIPPQWQQSLSGLGFCARALGGARQAREGQERQGVRPLPTRACKERGVLNV